MEFYFRPLVWGAFCTAPELCTLCVRVRFSHTLMLDDRESIFTVVIH